MTFTHQIGTQNSWKPLIEQECQKPYMKDLQLFLEKEKSAGKTIFPQSHEYFLSLELTPLENVKIVILGQDPYHGDDQAHGLAFSVRKNVRTPPSLKNIYKELQTDIGIEPPNHGFLEDWAKQGVLLLNSVLTVERALAASHRGQGWEQFTDAIITHVNKRPDPTVFMLWGSHAQKKAAFVGGSKHLTLKAPHPSPLSAHRGFLGCQHFSKANAFLKEHSRGEINWKINNG